MTVQEKRGIHICRLSKSFGDHVVFQDLDLMFPEGRTTCLMGPSGSGKTTLLRILLGLEKPDRGSVEGLEGKKFSAVFQEPCLCENLSAYANIRMVCRKKWWENDRKEREEISCGMEALGLAGCENKLVHEMSGGMRQRVALLRAFHAEWDILFLDEPFRGLDEGNKRQVMEYTRRACTHKTVILVTHSDSEAQQMGNIVYLPYKER